jgi:hypothetical protein
MFIGGDFNVEIAKKGTRKVSKSESNALRIIKGFCEANDIGIVSDDKTHPWYNKKVSSTLDYIFSNLDNGGWNSKNLWGIDKSDHAVVQAQCESKVPSGLGIPRIDPSFLEINELRETFRENLIVQLDQIPIHWDPHKKLEYAKVAIRSEAFHVQCLMKKEISLKLQDLHEKFQVLVEKLNKETGSERVTYFNQAEDVGLEINEILEDQSKRLAQRARVQWIEKGERTNKYFLNIIKGNKQKQAFATMVDDKGLSITKQDKIIQHIHIFYSELYQEKATIKLGPTAKLNLVSKEDNSLSCSLFILLMDHIIRNVNNSGVEKINMHGHELKNTIGYADDLAIIVKNKRDIKLFSKNMSSSRTNQGSISMWIKPRS